MSRFRLTTRPDPHGPTLEGQDQHPPPQLGRRGQSLVKTMWFLTSFFLGSTPPLEITSCGSSLMHLQEAAKGSWPKAGDRNSSYKGL